MIFTWYGYNYEATTAFEKPYGYIYCESMQSVSLTLLPNLSLAKDIIGAYITKQLMVAQFGVGGMTVLSG